MFFSQFGEIVEAKLARNYFGTLLDYTKQARIEVKYNLEKRKNDINGGKSIKKLARINRKIEKLKRGMEEKLKQQFQDVPKVIYN